MIEQTNDSGVWTFPIIDRRKMSSVHVSSFTKPRFFDWGALSIGSTSMVEIFLYSQLVSLQQCVRVWRHCYHVFVLCMCKTVYLYETSTYEVFSHFCYAKSGDIHHLKPRIVHGMPFVYSARHLEWILWLNH